MDQIKIGGFLKDLRKEKGITQEQKEKGVGNQEVIRIVLHLVLGGGDMFS